MIGCDVIHQSLWLVLSIHDTEISVDTIVSIWASHSLLQELDEFLIVSELLVVLEKIFQVIWMNDDLKTTKSSSLELFGSDTSEADSLPNLWDVSFLSSFISSNVVFKHDMNLSKFLIVSNSSEENFGSQEKLVVIASLSNLE
jgi:hypothetical protein